MLRPAFAPALVLLACSPPAASTTSDAGAESDSATSIGASSSGASSSGAAATASTGGLTGGVVTTGEPATAGTTGEVASTGPDATTGGLDPGPRYDEVRQKSAHNSFQRQESLFDQLVYHRIRSLEFDVHVGKTLEPDVAGEWYVYHVDVVDDESHCRTLSQCAAQVAAFARAVPEHEVVTLWIDLKDGFDAEHRPQDLDARLEDAFGAALWTPGDLLAACPGATSLQAAITSPGCDWPTLAAMRGRVVVALTGGDLDDPDGTLATYAGDQPATRAAFVAPGASEPAQLGAHDEAVIFNLAVADVALAADVRAAGFVSRVWVLDDAGAWGEAVAAGAHHFATNQINVTQDAWSTTAAAALRLTEDGIGK